MRDKSFTFLFGIMLIIICVSIFPDLTIVVFLISSLLLAFFVVFVLGEAIFKSLFKPRDDITIKTRDDIAIIKKLLDESALDAKTFLELAIENGFKVESEDWTAMFMVSSQGRLVFSVLHSYGSNIFSLNYQAFGEGTKSVSLINEGKRTY